ncbi:hypothetical protein [Actinomadura rugatobispora]|uniref:Uncharacterized protein n=1 Tax=Actinomadura rugatobispora TaxID=1994 RepID=A0ABW0ZUU0_9ACTN
MSKKREIRDALRREARGVPASEVAPYYERLCRSLAAEGRRDEALLAFTMAREAEPDPDMDRLHGVFLEFTPVGLVAPGTLRDHVRLMAGRLRPEEAHGRYQEILDASFAAGRIPDEQLLAYAVRLGKAAGAAKHDVQDALVAKLLRAGLMPDASHGLWHTAHDPLVRATCADPELLDLLIGAEPTGERRPALVGETRRSWLSVLASARAGVRVPATWFFTVARACDPGILQTLAGQAVGLFAEVGHGVGDDPALPYPARPFLVGGRPPVSDWYRRDDAVRAVAAELEAAGPGVREAFKPVVEELAGGMRADAGATFRRFYGEPAVWDVLRELVGEWRAEAASGSVPEMAHALHRLAALAEGGFGEGVEIADPVEALLRTLRGGIRAELAHPMEPTRSQSKYPYLWHRRTVLQHGDWLTVDVPGAGATVYGPDGSREEKSFPSGMPWYDGGSSYVSRYERGRWQTYRVVGRGGEVLLSLDPETCSLVPRSPSCSEVVFPGAGAPSRVEYARGVLRVTAPDGTVTERLAFEPTQSLFGGGALPVLPPAWWPLMGPADPGGSAVLRSLDRAGAARLLDAALVNDAPALAGVSDPLLRDGIAHVADQAAWCVRNAVRLRDALGVAQPDEIPRLVRTRPGLPAGPQVRDVAAIRRLAGVLEEAAASGEPGTRRLDRVEALFPVPPNDVVWVAFWALGYRALQALHAWEPDGRPGRLPSNVLAWANTPWGDGSGRWRLLSLTKVAGDARGSNGEVWRTPDGALVALNRYPRGDDRRLYGVEFSPDAAFGPPPDIPGLRNETEGFVQGWGGADRIAEANRLLAERGPAPMEPSWARELAERTGMPRAWAARVCYDFVDLAKVPERFRYLFAGEWPGRGNRVPQWKLLAVRDRLVPDDPSEIWEGRLDLDRAAALYLELIAGTDGPSAGS